MLYLLWSADTSSLFGAHLKAQCFRSKQIYVHFFNSPRPKTKREVRQFLGLAEYYCDWFHRPNQPFNRSHLTVNGNQDLFQWAFKSLPYYLVRRSLTLCSDHALLQWLHCMKDASAQITRQLIVSGYAAFKFKAEGCLGRVTKYAASEKQFAIFSTVMLPGG